MGADFGAKKRFVLAQGAGVSAAEVVRRAQKAGFELSTAYVYVLRSKDRLPQKAGKSAGRGATAKKTVGRGATTNKAVGRGATTNKAAAERVLASIALELGLARARELLVGLKRQAL